MANQAEEESELQLHGLRDVLSGSVPDLTHIDGLHYRDLNLPEPQAYSKPLTFQTAAESSKFPSRDIRGRLPVGRPKSQDIPAHVLATTSRKSSSLLKLSPSTPALPNYLFRQNNNASYSHSPQWSLSSADSSSPLYMADGNHKRSRSSISLNKENDDPGNPRSISPTPPSSRLPDKRSNKGRDGLSNIHNKIHPQSVNRPSVKHLTCYWWKTKGVCRFSEEDCLYSHHDTGKIADAPRHLIPGEKAVAGRNLENRLAQYMTPPLPADSPSVEPGWRAPLGLGYAQAAPKASGTDKPASMSMRSQHSAKPSREVIEHGDHFQSPDPSVTGSVSTPETAVDYSYHGADTSLATEPKNQTSPIAEFQNLQSTLTGSPLPTATTNDTAFQNEIYSLRNDKLLLQNLLTSSTRDKEFLQTQLTQASIDKQMLHNQLAAQQMENQTLHSEVENIQNQLVDTIAEKEDLERILTRHTATIQHLKNQNTNVAQGPLRSSASMASFLTAPDPGQGPGPIERPKPGKKRATFGF